MRSNESEAHPGPVDRALAAIEAEDRLDRPAQGLANAVSSSLQVTGRAAQPTQNILHGTWFGHPIHPLIVALPIGAWTLALGLDAVSSVGQRRAETQRAADSLIAAGAVAAVAAALTGLADWRSLHGRERRTGFVHATLNSSALGLHVASLLQRRRGRRGLGRMLSATGWLAMFGGGYLGGHMVYRRRVGVDQADRSPEPRVFTPVIALDALEEGRPHRVEIPDPEARIGVGVAVVRHQGRVHALGSRCSHWGGPLDEGWVFDGGLVCPWHGSRFCLKTGKVLDGPSTSPQPRYETRVRDGMVEIRHVPEPGDESLTPDEVASAGAGAETGDAQSDKTANEVLFEHHQLLRRLFEEIERTPREDPSRRDLMLTLAAELEIHEQVEDAIFYPAVRPVSEDVPIAHAEHQQLADMLAVTLRVGTATKEFDEHLRALHEAVDHHASSEERSMFKEAERLGAPRLRELGAQIEAMLDHERTSRAKQAFRSLKIRLLEGTGSARRSPT